MGVKINKVRIRKEGVLSEAQDFIVGDEQVFNDSNINLETTLNNLATEEDIDTLFPTSVKSES